MSSPQAQEHCPVSKEQLCGEWGKVMAVQQGNTARVSLGMWQHSHGSAHLCSCTLTLGGLLGRNIPVMDGVPQDLLSAGDGVNNSSKNLRDELWQEETWEFSFWICCLHSPGTASLSSCRHGSHKTTIPSALTHKLAEQRARFVKCTISQGPDSQRSQGAQP